MPRDAARWLRPPLWATCRWASSNQSDRVIDSAWAANGRSPGLEPRSASRRQRTTTFAPGGGSWALHAWPESCSECCERPHRQKGTARRQPGRECVRTTDLLRRELARVVDEGRNQMNPYCIEIVRRANGRFAWIFVRVDDRGRRVLARSERSYGSR